MPFFTPYKGMTQIASSTALQAETNPGWSPVSGAASATKGAWTRIFSSMYPNMYLLRLIVRDIAVAATSSLATMDVGVGPAGSEVVVVPDLLCGGAPIASGNPYNGREFWIPLFVPQFTAVSVRFASERTSATFKLVAWAYIGGGSNPPPWRLGQKVTTYGIGTVPNGTTIVPGASTAQGAWTQVVAATTRDHFCFFPSFQVAGTTLNARSIYLGMGYGGAGVEENFQSATGYCYVTTTNEEVFGPYNNNIPMWQTIPAGTRLVMRASNTGTNDTGPYQVAIHALG
jgi:hypothetical protein